MPGSLSRTHVYLYLLSRAHRYAHDPLARVSECSVAGSAPEILMTAMVLQAGVETRSAMAFYVDIADYTASADKAYADVEPTVCRLDE